MCLDPNAMEWVQALQTHAPPPDKVGFVYMLNGDTGASNTDPWATKPEPDNHWVQTGSHVMIVGTPRKDDGGLSADNRSRPDETLRHVAGVTLRAPHAPCEVRLPTQDLELGH
jgi:hypothetical protein